MYSVLDTKKTSELYVVRQDWFSPEYELTDNVYRFGKITYNRLSGRRAAATTATCAWVFRRDSIFSRTISITDPNGVIIGRADRELFNRKTVLKLESGLQAVFYQPSIWAGEYIWESEGYGKIMHLRSNPFSLRGTIYIDQSLVPPALIPLLTFFGTYLVILSRRRRSRH